MSYVTRAVRAATRCRLLPACVAQPLFRLRPRVGRSRLGWPQAGLEAGWAFFAAREYRGMR
eukprot:7374811-Alexandrium_andersonii.AAC.1